MSLFVPDVAMHCVSTWVVASDRIRRVEEGLIPPCALKCTNFLSCFAYLERELCVVFPSYRFLAEIK